MSPPTEHPSQDLLTRFLQAREAREEGDAVRIHLAGGCLHCLREAHRLIPAVRPWVTGKPVGLTGTPAERQKRLALLVEHAERAAALLHAEDVVAPRLLAELLRLSPGARRAALRETTSFRFLAVAEHLVERSRESVFDDVAQAFELAQLAVEASECLDGRVYASLMILDAQALAWAALGNAHRVQSDLMGADRAFDRAQDFLADSFARDPWNRGEVLSLLGSLRIDQCRYGAAREVLEEALETFRRGDEPSNEAKALIKLAQAVGEAGEPERAIPHLERARRLLGDREPKLRLIAGHYLVQALNDAVRVGAATDRFEQLQAEYDAHGGEFGIAQRRVWLAARLAHGRGELDLAEGLFRKVRDGFLERGVPYDLALSSLEMSLVYLEQGRTGDVRRLAQEMIPLFSSRQLHGHALAALSLFQQAAAAESATAELVRDVLSYLRRARNNPDLPYPGATAS